MVEHFNHWLPKLLCVLAITIGNHTYYSLKQNHTPQWLRRHEAVHVEQNKRDGFVTFNSRYIGRYLELRINGFTHEEAHDRLEYEQEAIDAERNEKGELY